MTRRMTSTTLPPPAESSAMTRPGSTTAIIALMLLMIGVMIGSFAYVSGQEAELRNGRLESRHIRVARQALMEADVAVLNAMVDGAAAHAGRYRTAIDKLDGQPVNHFPPTIRFDRRETSTLAVIASVRRGWTAIMERIEAGDLAGARALHDTLGIRQRATAVGDATIVQIAITPPMMNRYQLNRFSRGNARSFAPSNIGTRKLPSTAGIDGIRKKKTMITPCSVKSLL